MGVLRIGPFDAERSWRPPDLARLPAVSDRQGDRVVAALDESLSVLCEPDDRFVVSAPLPTAFVDLMARAGFTAGHLVLPDLVDADLLASGPAPTRWSKVRAVVSGMELAPYAMLRSTATLRDVLGLTGSTPPYATVVDVNSKCWSNEVVRRHGWFGAGEVAQDAAGLRRLVAALGEAEAVVKDPYGVAGRGSLVVTSSRVLDSIVKTVEAQVAKGAYVELIVQPRYRRRLDFSAQWEIRPDGSAESSGLVQTDNRDFVYAGTRPAGAELVQRLDRIGYHEIAATVVSELGDAGYHGPVCIDGMVLEDGTVIPVLEVNARTSMGMIGMALQARATSAGLQAVLRHLPARIGEESSFDRLAQELDRLDLAFDGSGPGILLVTAGTLIVPRGRLCLALFVEWAGDEAGLLRNVVAAAERVGIRIYGNLTTRKASA